MKLLFKQRFFSWFDSYDIYDENGDTAFRVEGKLSWGHRFHIYDADGQLVGQVVQKVLSFLPRFELYDHETCLGEVKKAFTFFRPVFTLSFNGWSVTGDFLGWDYEVTDQQYHVVMRASKQLFNWTDTYVIDIDRAEDALVSLMIVLAIDAEKCSSSS